MTSIARPDRVDTSGGSRPAGTPVSPAVAAKAARASGSASTLPLKLATYLTGAVAILCPLPFGSVDNFWVALWTLPLAAALCVLSGRRVVGAHAAILLPVVALVLVVVCVVVLQLTPNPRFAAPHPIWSQAEDILKQPLPRMVTVDGVLTWAALGRPLLLLLAFCCAFLAATDRDGAGVIFAVVAYGGAAYAVYAVAAQMIEPGMLLGVEKAAYISDLTGTFVNRNTAATFFGVIAILWLVRFLTDLDRRLPKSELSVRGLGAALVESPTRDTVIAPLCLCVALAALLMTRSRAGIFLTFGCMFLSALLVLRQRISQRAGRIGTLAVLILIGIFVLELFGSEVALRIGLEGLIDSSRVGLYRSTLKLIADHPLLGTGLGTFNDVYPAYRDPAGMTMGIYDKAHNVPLEIAAELGVPVAAAVVLLFLAGLGRLLAGSLTRRRDNAFAIAACGAALLGGLHSLVDFSPQIPGFGVFWTTLLAAGLAQSISSASAAPVHMKVRPRSS